VEIAWLRKCEWCDEEFLVCRRCGFNRRYCTDVCAAAAHRHRRRMHRRTDEGKAEHRAEEGARRERLRAQKHMPMGGWLSRPGASGVTVRGMEATPTIAATEPSPPSLTTLAAGPPPSARPPGLTVPRHTPGVAASTVVAPATPPRVGTRDVAAPPSRDLQWRLVVGLALADRAQVLCTSQEAVCCAGCGRAGRVAAVEVKRHLWVDEAAWDRCGEAG
jgi:hypothetical protein